jgi:diamine N-acetyltransferase
MKISLNEAELNDLENFHTMEMDQETAKFIIPYTLEMHRGEFSKACNVYLSVSCDGNVIGFFILGKNNPRERSIEFRRLVVREKGHGYGQAAILALHEFCKLQYQANRIWLDVFDFNSRGRHIYEKLGYQQFGTQNHPKGVLILYEICI